MVDLNDFFSVGKLINNSGIKNINDKVDNGLVVLNSNSTFLLSNKTWEDYIKMILLQYNNSSLYSIFFILEISVFHEKPKYVVYYNKAQKLLFNAIKKFHNKENAIGRYFIDKEYKVKVEEEGEEKFLRNHIFSYRFAIPLRKGFKDEQINIEFLKIKQLIVGASENYTETILEITNLDVYIEYGLKTFETGFHGNYYNSKSILNSATALLRSKENIETVNIYKISKKNTIANILNILSMYDIYKTEKYVPLYRYYYSMPSITKHYKEKIKNIVKGILNQNNFQIIRTKRHNNTNKYDRNPNNNMYDSNDKIILFNSSNVNKKIDYIINNDYTKLDSYLTDFNDSILSSINNKEIPRRLILKQNKRIKRNLNDVKLPKLFVQNIDSKDNNKFIFGDIKDFNNISSNKNLNNINDNINNVNDHLNKKRKMIHNNNINENKVNDIEDSNNNDNNNLNLFENKVIDVNNLTTSKLDNIDIPVDNEKSNNIDDGNNINENILNDIVHSDNNTLETNEIGNIVIPVNNGNDRLKKRKIKQSKVNENIDSDNNNNNNLKLFETVEAVDNNIIPNEPNNIDTSVDNENVNVNESNHLGKKRKITQTNTNNINENNKVNYIESSDNNVLDIFKDVKAIDSNLTTSKLDNIENINIPVHNEIIKSKEIKNKIKSKKIKNHDKIDEFGFKIEPEKYNFTRLKREKENYNNKKNIPDINLKLTKLTGNDGDDDDDYNDNLDDVNYLKLNENSPNNNFEEHGYQYNLIKQLIKDEDRINDNLQIENNDNDIPEEASIINDNNVQDEANIINNKIEDLFDSNLYNNNNNKKEEMEIYNYNDDTNHNVLMNDDGSVKNKNKYKSIISNKENNNINDNAVLKINKKQNKENKKIAYKTRISNDNNNNNNIEQIKLGDNDIITYDLGKVTLLGNKKKPNINIISSKGNSGGSYIELPDFLKSVNTILNFDNRKKFVGHCFLLCTIAGINKINTVNKLWNIVRKITENGNIKNEYADLYKRFNETENMKTDDITAFAKLNKIRYNVWELIEENSNEENSENNIEENGLIYKLKSPNIYNLNCNNVINLLLYKNHYCYISKLTDLFEKIKCNDITQCYMCRRMMFFDENEKVFKHYKSCKVNEKYSKYTMPTEFDIKFKDKNRNIRHPFVIYCDIESILIKDSTKFGKNSQYVNKHEPVMVGCCSNYLKDVSYTLLKNSDNENCITKFISYLSKECSEIHDMFYKSPKIVKSIDSFCRFCDLEICNSIDHYRDKFSNYHIECFNLFKKTKNLKVIFHNLKGYDSHFFINEFANKCKDFYCIPQTKEKYASFSGIINKVKISFIDSLGFLNCSLDSLSSQLTLDKYKYINQKTFGDYFESAFAKLPFPYEYVDSFEKLNENLPTNHKSWDSELSGKRYNQEQIKSTIDKSKEIKAEKIGQYMEFYLKVDVFLLMEVFEEFRNNSITTYSLDPCYYITTPALAWDCALKTINDNDKNFSIELLDKKEYIDFFLNKGTIRGGISTVSTLQCKTKESNTTCKYFDVTNLYGWAMTQNLPYGGFKFEDATMENYYKFLADTDDTNGYIFEVDIEIPIDIHEKTKDLPLFPEHVDNKLIPNLNNKKNYITYKLNLKQGISIGAKVTFIHKILSFKQKPWLSNYININTEKRKNTQSISERNFYKLMNNSVYGKTMENVLKRSKYKFYGLNDFDNMREDFSNYLISYFYKYIDNLYISETICPIEFNKPIYIGFVILELSKLKMYDLYYNYLKPELKTTLMYMDTDSFIVSIDGNPSDVVIKMQDEKLQSIFDYSVYDDSKIDKTKILNKNKGVIGTLKDEYPNKNISEFIALRSKCYAIRFEDNSEFIRNKGNRSGKVNFDDFKKTLDNPRELKTYQTLINSKNHEVHTVKIFKTTLTDKIDTKRIYKSDNLTEPIGYIKNN